MIDQVYINIKSGNGGNGAISGRHEKFIPRGGPDGGDGGNGGDVIFRGNRNINTLIGFRYKKIFKAENGGNGASAKKHGKNGKSIYIDVPTGTQIVDSNEEIIFDIVEHDQEEIVIFGGQGGYGNVKYTSSTNQYPVIAQNGENGVEMDVKLELKVLADVGIIGAPNAGKSSLITFLTSAKPKIANYPFTTLEPVLGILDYRDVDMVIVDIPGLIEGAHNGIGLGHDFLRHIERCKVLIHLVDASSDNPKKVFENINNELELFSSEIKNKPQIIVFNKIDLEEVHLLQNLIAESMKSVADKIYFISAISGAGVSEMMDQVILQFENFETPKSFDLEISKSNEEFIPVIQPLPKRRGVSVYVEDEVFVVESPGVERIATRIDYEDWMARMQFYKHLKTTGVVKALEDAGITSGDTVRIGDVEWDWD
ncbi:MAG: GTPase ObgE [Dehalococcoidia bacterium]|tara:strand:- start:2452 stop:3726 length:1275 start_codon:yes stop_codon:yes gene_type:complete